MTTHRIQGPTFDVVQQSLGDNPELGEDFLLAKDAEFRAIAEEFPEEVRQISMRHSHPPVADPLEEIEVELSDGRLRRVFHSFSYPVEKRMATIASLVSGIVDDQSSEVRNIVTLFGDWMLSAGIVRVVGAGRALLAASMPANRLAHGGALVWILGDRSPLPNSRLGGGILAASASGRTPAVIEIMQLAQHVNKESAILKRRELTVVGIASSSASDFRSLCTPGYFLALPPVEPLTLAALADIHECVIAELLDCLVVAAGLEIGANFRIGHEDLVGPFSGPWHQHE